MFEQIIKIIKIIPDPQHPGDAHRGQRRASRVQDSLQGLEGQGTEQGLRSPGFQ